jgi:hypothetical protein
LRSRSKNEARVKRVHSGIDYLTPSELEEGIKTDPSLASRFMLQL